jgi:hypothetical protein
MGISIVLRQKRSEMRIIKFESRITRWVGLFVCLMALWLPAKGEVETACPADGTCGGANTGCGSAGIVITGTSLGKDNIHLNVDNVSNFVVDWIVDSPCGNGTNSCNYTAFTGVARFILDGGAGPSGTGFDARWNHAITDDLDGEPHGSGRLRHSHLPKIPNDQSYLFNHECKHTLQIVASVRDGAQCALSNVVEKRSNPITVWIDNKNTTSKVENQASCSEKAPSCKAAERGRPVDIATGEMYHQMVDLRRAV